MNTTWQDVERLNDCNNIFKVEGEIGIKFPHLFVEIINKYNAGCPLNNIFDTEKERGRVFSTLLTFNLEESNSITCVYNYVKDRIPNGVVPFADDPSGNYICFDYRKTSIPQIVFWHHEENFVINEDNEIEYPEVNADYELHDIDYVDPNLFEFLRILYKEEEVEIDFSDFEEIL